MILINLLPHREEKRQLRKQAFFHGIGTFTDSTRRPNG